MPWKKVHGKIRILFSNSTLHGKTICRYISGWKLFNKLSNVEQERNAARDWAIEMYNHQRNERMKRKAKLEQEKRDLTDELKKVKGLFAGMKRKELEERINKIDTQIFDLE